ncbi:MAG: flagellar basal body-associated FliL family protein [Acidimicrobiales bacterium]
MADDVDDEEEEEEGGGGKKKIIMLVGVLAIGGAAYQFVLKPTPTPDELAAAEEEAAAMEEELIEGEIVEMEEMILNIGDAESPGFLRIGLALVLDEATMAADFEAESAIAKDVAIHYLSSISQEQLRSPEGRQLAKDELGMLIREAYGEEKVVRVLFTALVMQ